MDPRERHDRVLTRDEQQQLTPDQVLTLLREGNARFVAGDVTHRDHQAQVRAAVEGQWPKAIVLSCVDSRIPTEDVFDCGIGDLFVARVAGNFVNVDILGSMEFACNVLVLGHEHCGAIKGAIDEVELGNLTALLAKIAPAVGETQHEGPHTSKNPDYVHRVAEQNVRLNLKRIRAESEVLAALEAEGAIAIVGAMYDMDDGTVPFLAEG